MKLKKSTNKRLNRFKIKATKDKIKSFNERHNKAREVKVKIIEYPNYYIDGTGLISYIKNGKHAYCKKEGNYNVYIFVNGNMICVNETELADKYVPGWREFRSIGNKTGKADNDKDVVYLKENETIKDNQIINKEKNGLPIGQLYIKKKGVKGNYFKSIENSK